MTVGKRSDILPSLSDIVGQSQYRSGIKAVGSMQSKYDDDPLLGNTSQVPGYFNSGFV
jgi:hypothetical protein